MLFKKIAIERIQISLSKATTSAVKKKRIRRGSYRMQLSIPYLSDGGVKYFDAEAVFMPNKSHLFIENSFSEDSLNDHVLENKCVLATAIKEAVIEEIKACVYTAFKEREAWIPGKGKNYVYASTKGTLSIRLLRFP